MNNDNTQYPIIAFKSWRCTLQAGSYANGRLALQLMDLEVEDFEAPLVATATVNLPDHDLPDGHVLIKNWSENAGLFQALLQAGYISDTGVRVSTGSVHAIQAKLTPLALRLLSNLQTSNA